MAGSRMLMLGLAMSILARSTIDAVFMLAVAHLAKARQVLGGCAGSKGAVHTGLAKVAAVHAHLLYGLFVHIGVAGFNQILRRAVHEVKVVAGLVGGGCVVSLAAVPVKAQPLHRVDDGVDVFGVFLLGVGVVKAQVAHAAVVTRQAKVDADALGVADVQVAIGLGRKTGADLGGVWLAGGVVGGVAGGAGPAALGVSAFFQIGFDDLGPGVATGVATAGREI